ncbi:eukaryotic translation initiation factor 4Bfamily protein [Striga asiatica]|uniref:Eukaryotic translation initiation factor 4Bfamily protein n=1 Tax=Striga asiatica TaxID=4170 RepID=A0A5A7R2B1_STRAF|nr:eukaryotic translation initiation factor 4Bfamily protein [Striga asiatica]
MSKSPWGKIGNWAAEAERAEAEEREAAEKAAASAPSPTFPSLKESVTTAKQKKNTKMTLQEFTMKQTTPSVPASSRGLTPEEMLRLPTGPKERSPDEMQHGRLGGGFSNYGPRPGYGGPNSGRPREYDGRRSYGFEDDNRRGPPPESRVADLNQPSRADEVDNWASMKKQTLPDYNSRQERPGGSYSSLGGGGGPGAGSRADEVDNWASVKKHFPQPQQARSSGFGSGFPRSESDRWTRNEQRSAVDTPKMEIDVGPKVEKPNPFGMARPREEVLAEKGLDWKKLDLEIEGKKQSSVSGGSRPTSSHSSRPGSQQSSRSDLPVAVGGEGVVKEKPKVNPFGNAKPREVLLEEKGLDWKKLDLELEHRRVERMMAVEKFCFWLNYHALFKIGPETEEEKNLKEEIEHLKTELLKKPVEDQTATLNLIRQKESDLELLVRQLDDKVRYSQKIFERKSSGPFTGSGFNERPPSRPGSQDEQRRFGSLDRPPSGHGKFEEPNFYENSRERPPSRQGAYEEPRFGFVDRPHLRHGGYEDPRVLEYNERPRSRGATGNSWSRSSDERRSFGGRGFTGGRETHRSGSRW